MAKANRKPTPVAAESAPVSFLDPTLLPNEYALRIRGDCMEPLLNDGSAVLVDQRQPYKSGDLVAIYLRPETVQPGHGNVILKRMISLPPWVKAFPYRDHPPSNALAALLVEMLNPHRFFGIRCADIRAIHHCVGPVPHNVKLTRVVGPRLAPVHASDIMKAKPSRRSILAGLAATPALVGSALALTSAGPPDPIFDLIERHKVAFRISQEASRIRVYIVDNKRSPKYDPVKLKAADEADSAASDASTDASNALTTVRPTTMAGVLALIRHVEAFNAGAFFLEPWPDRTVSDWQSRPIFWPESKDDDDIDLFGYAVLANVRSALEAMAAVS